MGCVPRPLPQGQATPVASLSSNGRIWGFCLGAHLLAVAKFPPSLSTSFILSNEDIDCYLGTLLSSSCEDSLGLSYNY